MSYRLPVIVSDIPANLEVGLEKEAYFPVGDIAALAQKLQQNIDAPYRQKEYPMENTTGTLSPDKRPQYMKNARHSGRTGKFPPTLPG